jgi:hypothetical protein
MKLPFKLTPGRRFAFAFWCGWAFHIASFVSTNSVHNKDWWTLGVAITGGLVLLWLYSKNKVAFEREMVWMTLQTGGPKEDDDDIQFPNRPMAPPPKPMNPPVNPFGKRTGSRG